MTASRSAAASSSLRSNRKRSPGGNFAKQVAALAKSITDQQGARLPNSRRAANQRRLAKEGLPIDRVLYGRLKSFADGSAA